MSVLCFKNLILAFWFDKLLDLGNLGLSVCCHVYGFEPYFYISCPAGMGPDDISRFQQTLEVSIVFYVQI